MEFNFTPKFVKNYTDDPEDIRKAFDKQSNFLLSNLRHPSLHAKKYDEGSGLWQARVTKDWRFYFTVEGDGYRLHDIKRHPK
jgi:mRNA-degrading endonuclease RelE of RelBE toxin-antitoxin system